MAGFRIANFLAAQSHHAFWADCAFLRALRAAPPSSSRPFGTLCADRSPCLKPQARKRGTNSAVCGRDCATSMIDENNQNCLSCDRTYKLGRRRCRPQQPSASCAGARHADALPARIPARPSGRLTTRRAVRATRTLPRARQTQVVRNRMSGRSCAGQLKQYAGLIGSGYHSINTNDFTCGCLHRAIIAATT